MIDGRTSQTDNLRGMALMTLGMAATASVDAVIKSLSGIVAPTQIIVIVGFGGALVFALAAWRSRLPLLTRQALHRTVILRNVFEVAGSFGTVLALALVPLTVVTVIGQAVPLMVTLGAVIFMGERAGLRVWLALLAGFVGMLVIVRPGLEGFSPAALVAVAAAAGLAARDLASRAAPQSVSTLQLGVWGLATLGATGVVLSVVAGLPWPPFTPRTVISSVAIVAFAGTAFFCITSAMRIGDVGVVSPFRYARLVFGVALGVVFFSESIDLRGIVGAGIIVASGLFIWRSERRRA